MNDHRHAGSEPGAAAPVRVKGLGARGKMIATLAMASWLIALPFAGSARAAENVTLENLAIAAGTVIYRAARIEVVGSSLDKAQLERLYQSADQPLSKGLAGLSAASVTIPEIVIERSVAAGKQTIVVRNVVLTTVVSGKIGALTAAGAAIGGPTPNDAGSLGPLSVKDLDLVAVAGDAAAAPSEAKALFSALSWTMIDLKLANSTILHLDGISVSDIKARPAALRLPGDPSGFIPSSAALTVTGLTMDAPGPKAPGDRQRSTVKSFSIRADNPINGIPSTVRIALDELVYVIPQNSGEASYKNVLELGYDTIGISFVLEGAWNETTKDFAISALALRLADMGSITLRAMLGNVAKEVFSGDGASALAALRAATLKDATLAIENQGLYEHAVVREAKRSGKPLEDVRRQIGFAAGVAVPNVLGASPNGRTLAKAVLDFVARPTRLDIDVKAKDRAGVPLTEYFDPTSAPAAMAEKLDVAATVK